MTHYEGISNMLDPGQVALLFGVHVSTVRRWSDRNLLKTYRIGPRAERRFRREDVAGLLLARAVRRYLETA